MDRNEQSNDFSLINVDKEKCKNCHSCISECPLKYCNNGSGEYVIVNHELCVGCGRCLSACTHGARYFIDDFERFLSAVKSGEKLIALVAPSASANFPNKLLKLNSWLVSLGVSKVIDVSFGAELAARSYYDLLNKNSKKTIIAQPCAAIVNYIQLYKPELLEFLAPVDSPVIHAAKMIRKFSPELALHKMVFISPCISKKIEFLETGLVQYNVGYISIDNYLKSEQTDLDTFPEKEFDNPMAERGVNFSTPGGFLKTLERWVPEVNDNARKIEGSNLIYNYFDQLHDSIKQNKSPLIIDCLSCEKGCNAGPLSLIKDKSIDEIEHDIKLRTKKMIGHYAKNNSDKTISLENTINEYWIESLYKRKYTDLSTRNFLKLPSINELEEIFISMHKYSDKDIFNCSSCGYLTCEAMAMAIYNGLNKPENCHFYLMAETKSSHEKIEKSENRLSYILSTTDEGFLEIDNNTKIIDVNPAFKKMLEYEDLVGRSLYEFLDDENGSILKNQLKIRAENKKSDYEITMMKSDGSKIFCYFIAAPLINNEGKKTGSFAMVNDITQRKLDEVELRKAKEELELRVLERTAALRTSENELKLLNANKDKFFSIISHDLRNPFSSLLGFTNFLLKDFDTFTADEIKSIVNSVNDSAHGLFKLVENLLKWSRLQSNKITFEPRELNLFDTVNNVINIYKKLAEEKDIVINQTVSIDLRVFADADMLQAIFRNLISNAIKFSLPGGIIQINAEKKNGHIQADITDDGVGISKSNIERLFKIEEHISSEGTSNEKGTGLGLILCKEFIERNGGNIWVNSEQGKGTTFSIILKSKK